MSGSVTSRCGRRGRCAPASSSLGFSFVSPQEETVTRRVKKHHRIQLNQLTLNPGDCGHGTGLKTQLSPQPRSQSTAVRSDHCLYAPPRRQQLQTKRFLNVPAGPAERTYVLTRAGPVRVVLVLPVSGAAEWDCGVGQQSTDGFVRFFFRRAEGGSSSCCRCQSHILAHGGHTSLPFQAALSLIGRCECFWRNLSPSSSRELRVFGLEPLKSVGKPGGQRQRQQLN